MPDGFAFAETFFGVLRAGAVFAMVNPLLKAGDFEHYIAYSKARVVVTHSSVLPEILAVAQASPHVETLLVDGLDAGTSLGENDPERVYPDCSGFL